MRLQFLRGTILFGVVAVALTEALGAFNLLRPWVVRIAWLAILLAGVGFAISRRTKRKYTIKDPVSLFGIGSVLAIVAPIAFTAWFSAPNTYDVIAYHMPRVVYWAQAGNVAFFPTNYLHQNLMPPFAEYIFLHLYLISGGDRLVNLVQAAALLGCAVGVSAAARELGAGMRGQVLAAVAVVTIPAAVLEASGAKNDVVLSFWLIAAVCFAVRCTRTLSLIDMAALGFSLALALLTKGTALILSAPIIAAALAPIVRHHPKKIPLILCVVALCVALVDGPFYARYFRETGGHFASFGLNNDAPNLGAAVSNALRNGATELGSANTTWDRGIYRLIAATHQKLGIPLNDPATTYWGCAFGIPQSSTHEALAPNLAHTLLLIAAFFPLAWRARRNPRSMLLYAGIFAAFILFGAVLKYQQYHPRLLLPLYAVGCIPIGLLAASLPPRWAQVASMAFLLWVASPYVFTNYLRPLTGSYSVLRTPREENYFSEMRVLDIVPQYKEAVRLVRESGCLRVGIDYAASALEYPLQALVLEANARARFFHTKMQHEDACMVVCFDCAGNAELGERYKDFDRVAFPPIVVFRRRRT
ncbi:MAG: glycosyltransferase family 39 protein [Acidobacteriota bacterium]|nr:glycosyltransferase family 39 protein [Acidobacteriota bacterium]